ncbi:MAG: type III polyketide synthase [Micromonosporaceae bacterium]
MRQQELWDGFFADHFGGSRRARALFLRAGARTRHGVANPLVEDVTGWSTGRRMRRYAAEALPLGKDAVAAALDDAGTSADDIGLLAVCSCTGYATPGLDVLLARDLGMPADVRRLSIGHMGCYAALPGLGAVSDYVTGHGRPAVLLCVELTSLHIQPRTDDLDQVVSHALFSDAAAAVVVTPGTGLRIVDVASRTDFATADHMSWEVTDLGFRMGLSPRVPDVLGTQVGGAVADLLRRHGLTVADVAGWAVHPGGPRILDVTGQALGLPADALRPSREVLSEHGNCSSATVLVVLREVARRTAGGSYVVAMAFGPGLTLYAALLRTPESLEGFR